MKQYKIKVKNEAESKEAQELFKQLGYIEPDSEKLFPRFGAVIAEEGKVFTDRMCFWNDYNDHDELSLEELRTLATPRLYLDAPPQDSSAWSTQVGGDHYKHYKIQPMEFALANNLDAAQANVIKYVMRHKDKKGLEDLQKAKHYIDLMIAHYYGGGV